ncbi:hypothetical protein FF38_14159 [Lucilia cuprina]|uniref:Regulatory protein zeste n=1 Tax=Lucilia cuprina TaxID=7375 RepID=A0A0L0BPH1_LUCCU|nr:hypothetical protein FF38_14159 [Lucilia cuprina]
MTDKKQRGKNFTNEEELLLVDLVMSQKHILENKKSDAVNWKIKNEAWMKFQESFKSQSGIHRPWKTLRGKYDNMKRKSKMCNFFLPSANNNINDEQMEEEIR